MTNIIAPPPIWPLELNSPMSMSYILCRTGNDLHFGMLAQLVGLSERLICQSYEPGMVRAYQVEAERDKLLNFIRPIRFGGPINN